MTLRGPRLGLPGLGFGIGLRGAHIPQILQGMCALDWFEIISENYLDCHGWRRHALLQIAERYPIVMHGVAMSIGNSAPLDLSYLAQIKQLAGETKARWVSDHLCWTGIANQTTHDLLPMPLNEASLKHVIARVRMAQDVLERPLVIENPSSYARFQNDGLQEWDFLRHMANEADCGLLLDVNNVYVSSVNHGFDPYRYIDALPLERVVQIHLAGHCHYGSHILDTHDRHVSDPVWRLYRYVMQGLGGEATRPSTLLEWDSNIPALSVMEAEIDKARSWASSRSDELPSATRSTQVHSVTPVHPTAPEGLNAYPALAGPQFEMD